MTETYRGSWDPVIGDRPKEVKEDPYHPKYPDVGAYPDTKVWGFVEKPATDSQEMWKLTNVSAAEVKE